jgi:hypothetical protein
MGCGSSSANVASANQKSQDNEKTKIMKNQDIQFSRRDSPKKSLDNGVSKTPSQTSERPNTRNLDLNDEEEEENERVMSKAKVSVVEFQSDDLIDKEDAGQALRSSPFSQQEERLKSQISLKRF